jgi:excisionase family DNA binding protein
MQSKSSSGDPDRRRHADPAKGAAPLPGENVEKNYTVTEAAERLSISGQSVYQLCSRKKLRHLRLGVGRGCVRIPASALDEFIKGATVQPEEPTAPQAPPRQLKHLKV